MNTRIQLHDTEVTSFNQTADSICIVFGYAMIYESADQPGLDPGRCWTQDAQITLAGNLTPVTAPRLPIWVFSALLRHGHTLHEEQLPTSGHFQGDIEFTLILSTENGSQDGGTIQIKATSIKIELLGEPSRIVPYDSPSWHTADS